jgi:hypothetical protein
MVERPMSAIARSVVACACVLWLAAPLRAAPPADSLEPIRRRLDELARVSAELPSALEAIHDLENRLGALERELDRLAGARASDEDVRRAIDDLRVELGRVDRRIAESQARLAELAAQPPSVELGYGRGLFLRAPPVEAVLNATIMPRYTGVIRGGRDHDTSSFEIHHAQIALDATLLRVIALRAMFDFGAAYLVNAAASVRDLWVEVRPLPWLGVRGGQFKIPFGRQRLVSSLALTFVERSLATQVFTADRDIGLLVEGAFFADRLLVQAAVTNGGEGLAGTRNDNLDLSYTARVVAQPLGPVPLVEGDRARTPSLRIGFGGAFRYDLIPTDQPPPLNDIDRNGIVDNVEVLTANAEAVAHWRGFALEGEYFFRRERPGFGRPVRDTHGAYVQTSAMVWRGLQLGARFSYAQPHALAASSVAIAGRGVPRSAIEANALASYDFWRSRVILFLQYSYRRDESADPADVPAHEGHVLEAQAQVGF